MGLPRRRQWQPTPVLLPGKSHGRRSLVGCSPWGREESEMTEQLHFHFSLSCIGEGNGNPLQCSCLENPRDGGARWAAVYGVAQSQTQLKRLSSSSSIQRLSSCNAKDQVVLHGKRSSPCFLYHSVALHNVLGFHWFLSEHAPKHWKLLDSPEREHVWIYPTSCFSFW